MSENKLSDEELKARVTEIFRALDVHSAMNAYAIENVVFGKLKQGDQIPFDRFVEELELQAFQPQSVRRYIEGVAITAKETVAEHDMELFLSECFIFHANEVFDSAPQRRNKDDDENGLHLQKKGIERLYHAVVSAIQKNYSNRSRARLL